MPDHQRKPSPKPSEATPTWPQLPPARLITPLDHMLGVLNDPMAAPNRKDKMAIASAPYCHARLAEKTKKVAEAEAARTAGGDDSEWAGDLDVDGGLRQ